MEGQAWIIWATPRWDVQWMRWRAQVRKAARSEGVLLVAEERFRRKSREVVLMRPPTSMQNGGKVSRWAEVTCSHLEFFLPSSLIVRSTWCLGTLDTVTS
jgi:hypothetical protein